MSATDLSKPNRVLQDPSGTITPHILLIIVQLVALSSPPFPGRRTISGSSIVGLAILAQLNSPFTQDLPSAQPWSLIWPHYLSTLEKIIFSGPRGPEGTLWRLDKPVQEAYRFSAFGFEKMKWAAAIIINLRGIGWNYEVKNVPRQAEMSRRAFLIKQCAGLVRLLFMTDVLLQLGSHLFFTAADGQLEAINSKLITLRHSDIRWGFVKTLVFGAGPYFFINLQYTACSIIAVSLGLSEAKDWPPFFGKLREVTTVRKFWGKFWHQSIRKLLTAFTSAFVDTLHIKRGSSLSSYTQLWLAFSISGFMHAASMTMLPAPININFSERTLGTLQFFLWQAAAISLEDLVQWISKGRYLQSKSSGSLKSCLGYVWVTCSMWYSLPFAGDVMLRLRLMEKSFLPFTLMGPWIKSYIPIP